MKNVNIHILLFLTVFVSASSTLWAQDKIQLSGVVSDLFGGLPGASVVVEGASLKTVTDINGNYVLDLSPGTYAVTASYTLYKPVTIQVELKNETDKNTVNFNLETGFVVDQAVSIVSKSEESNLISASASVEVITAQDIANTTQRDLAQVLQYLVPSFHSARQTQAGVTDHVDPAALRGLGPDQILVLINGKRRHNSALLHIDGTVGRGTAGVDFNAIPVAAIERIEILRDGGTAQYGNDAIAGVINIILKKNTGDTKVFAHTGVNTAGDGNYNTIATNTSFSIGEEGYVNLTAQLRKRDATNRSGAFTGTVFTNDIEEDQQLIDQNDFFGQTGLDDERVLIAGSAATENLSVVLNSELPISENSSFYLLGTRNTRISSSRGFYAFPKQIDRVVPELFPNGFSPEINVNTIDNSLFGGFKKEIDRWYFDFSHGIGTNRINIGVNNTNNASLGEESPRNFFAGSYRYVQHITNVEVKRDFNLFKKTFLAAGAELRREVLATTAGDVASFEDGGATVINGSGEEIPTQIGTAGFIGLSEDDALTRSRTINSIYLQADSEITDKLFFRAIVRTQASKIMNMERRFQWNFATRYSFSDNLGLYASFSRANRIPSLHQMFFQNVSSQVISTGPARIGTLNTQSEFVRDLGIRLRPELSNYFSIGLNGRLSEKLNFGFNFYNISIKDRIVLSGRISEGFDDIFEPLNIDIAQVFTNALDSNTTGFDAFVQYQNIIGRGRLISSLRSNITRTTVGDEIRIPDIVRERGAEEVFFSREEIARVVSAQPDSKFIWTSSYDINNFRFLLRNTYFGTVDFLFPLDANPEDFVFNEFIDAPSSRDQLFTGKVLTDLSVTYKLNNNLNINVAGNNILNVFPDRINHSALTGQGQFEFSRRVQQFNVDGANFLLGLQLSF